MPKFIGRWFKIYEEEIGLFLGAIALLFLVRTSGMFFNNFAETAFLKRYGVEYLPVMYMVNSLTIFFIMGFMSGLMTRIPGARLLSLLLVFCGVTVAGSRFLIPLGFDLIYPVLFALKTLYEALLGLLFWNLANDLFNTRQSKRLFPLLSAGGVCGDILGGFATPTLARLITLDNLLLVYLGTTLLGALVVQSMGKRFPTLLIRDPGTAKKKGRRSIIGEIKNAVPLMKDSFLVKILIFMTFFPNLIIPIMNYQFNFAVNEHFATEGGLVAFFGYFRGSMNIVSLVILLFIGRIYGRWGLPVALMFHPANYLFVFIGFLLRFDIISAIYARMSTNIIRTTLNKPASDILMGLIPVSYRAVLRPFLRGTVVRVALLLGSGLILISGNLFHPRYLAIVAIPFVIAWLITIVTLKRRYSSILIDLISKDLLDLKSMEDKDLVELFRDKKIRERMISEFSAARGRGARWYARLMHTLGFPNLDGLLLSAVKRQDDDTRIALLGLLSPGIGDTALPILVDLAVSENPKLRTAAVTAANRLAPEISDRFDHERFLEDPVPETRAQAVIGLFQKNPGKCRRIIDTWLAAENIEDRLAGVIAAGGCGSRDYLPELEDLMKTPGNRPILPAIITALDRIGVDDPGAVFSLYLTDASEPVRLAALEAITIETDDELGKVIDLLGDPSDAVHDLAKQKIEGAPYQSSRVLIEALSRPRRRIREGLFELLEKLNIKDLDAIRFAREQIKAGYGHLAETERLKRFAESPRRDLLIDHLNQKRALLLENILRVLAAQDRSGQMHIILKGISSSDGNQRANGVEALDERVDKSLSKILIPLLEISDSTESLAVGRAHFKLDGLEANDSAFVEHLLASGDWVTVALTLSFARDLDLKKETEKRIAALMGTDNPHVCQMARCVAEQRQIPAAGKEDTMEKETTITDKILLLKGIEIFEGLSVSELAAVASVTEELDFPAGEVVIREGNPGETMYLIIRGQVSVIKGLDEASEIELDRIESGDYFGEMALFEDIARTASIRTETSSRLLVLHKQEFKEIVREYPQIALEICKVLSERLRRLHKKLRP